MVYQLAFTRMHRQMDDEGAHQQTLDHRLARVGRGFQRGEGDLP